MRRLPSVVMCVAALRRRVFSCENLDSGTKVSVGEAGLEEMQEAKEGVIGLAVELEDQEDGAHIGRGCRVTLVTGLHGSEVTISQYCSRLYADKE